MGKGKNKESGISISDMATAIALFGLAFFTCIGAIWRNVGDIASGVITGVIVLAITLLLLVVLVKAKKAQDHIKQWRIVEWGMLVVYLVVAVVTGYLGITHFFAVQSQKKEIKEIANQELEQIEEVINDYTAYYGGAIESHRKSLENVTLGGYALSAEVNEYLTDNVKFHDAGFSIEEYMDSPANKIDNGILNNYKDKATIAVNDINNWAWWKIAQVPGKLDDYRDKMKENMNQKYQDEDDSFVYPVFKVKKNYATGNAEIMFDKKNNSRKFSFEESELSEKIKNAEGGETNAWSCLVVLHFFILSSYIWANRSHKVRPGDKKGNNVGGIKLDHLV